MLELIQGRGRTTGSKTSPAELECSERTIFRDLAVLELAGVPWFFDEDQRSYRVRPGFNFPALNLTDDELHRPGDRRRDHFIRRMNVTKGHPAPQKFRATLRDDSAKLLAVVQNVTAVLHLKLADHHSRHRETIRTVQWAIIEGRRLTGTYASPSVPGSRNGSIFTLTGLPCQTGLVLIAQPRRRPAKAGRLQNHPIQDTSASRHTIRGSRRHSTLESYFGQRLGRFRGKQSYEVQVH